MWADILLLLVISICVITDLKSRTIYNVVIFPALTAAFVIQAVTGGWNGLADSFLGFILGFCILIIPYLLGGMGAGDVKLLALVGALQGASFVFDTAVYMALIGGVIALAVILFKDGIRERLRLLGYVLFCLRFRFRPNLQGVWTAGAYPYGIAIAGGSALCLWLKGWGAG